MAPLADNHTAEEIDTTTWTVNDPGKFVTTWRFLATRGLDSTDGTCLGSLMEGTSPDALSGSGPGNLNADGLAAIGTK